MIKEAIAKIVNKEDLTEEEAREVMQEIMEGNATPAQIASFITGLRFKGETVEEITGCVRVMREKVIRINTGHKIVVDTCGTGGDRKQEFSTFNISTVSAFVVAGAGLAVAKHGNRSVSSHCGSADLLEEAGVKIDISPQKMEECINEIGIGFLFAPLLHPAMKFALQPRREIGIRTIFNILGPLTNPAGASHQMLGVCDSTIMEKVARVLMNVGAEHALVVYGEDGLDEISITKPTRIVEVRKGKIHSYTIRPEDFGFKRRELSEISGGDRKKNVKIMYDILKGKGGGCRDIVLLNAAGAIVAGDMAENLKDGIAIAKESIDSGMALKKLEQLIEFTRE